ncbi:MAG: tetratricopeptide repeat protein [Asgard group archaeon]|nr:tetratricopeptide repeat protein [Asgard group archaeon]
MKKMNDTDKEKRKFLLEHTSEAQSLMSHGKKDEALACYDKILDEYPDELSALYGKGMIYYEFNDFSDALKCFDKVLAIDPNDVNSLYAKGSVLRIIGQPSEAMVAIDKVIELESKFAIAYLAKGYILMDLKKYDEALTSFSKVEEMGREQSVLAGKGYCYLMLGKEKEAIDHFERALKIDPYDPEALFGLGQYEYQMKNWKQAHRYLHRCVVQDDDNIDAWVMLADIFKNTNQTEEEKIALDKVKELEKKN